MNLSSELTQFEAIFKSHHARLCNLSYKIVGEKDTAQDIVQNFFIKFWEKKDRPEIDDLKSYLNKSVVNASLNHLKSVKNKSFMALSAIQESGPNTTEEAFNKNELETKISLAIQKLPPKCQTIFALSRFENMPSKEIASHLDLSIKTVDNQIGIALSKLREELKPYLLPGLVILALLWLLLQIFFQ